MIPGRVPIRQQIGLLLLIATLNVVVLSSGGLVLLGALNEGEGAREAWRAQLGTYMPALTIWLVLTSAASLTLAVGLRSRLSAPLEALREAAEAVAAGDVAAPTVTLAHAAPEIQALARSTERARERLTETIEALDQRNRQISTMLGQLADAVFLVAPEGQVIEANLAAQALLASISRAWPADLSLASVLPELELDHGGVGEVEVERKLAGRLRTFIASVRQVPPAHRRTGGGWVVVLRDVTSEREAERTKREFISVVTHELKTPLVTIEGFTKLLLMKKAGELTPRQHTWVENIREQGQVLLGMVSNLLDVSRLDGGNLTIDVRPVPADGLMARWEATWRPVVEHRGFEFEASLPPTRARLRVDEHRLDQVIGNLFNNAMKFTPMPGRIGLALLDEGAELCIAVWDSGRGIPADAVPRLFEKFYQVEKGDTRIAGGAGLGLYIVHELITAQGGRISVHSREGAGSRFEIRFPVHDRERSDA